MDYNNILFDLDGTLTDPKDGITNSVVYALSHFGISVSDKNTLCRFIGPPLSYSFSEYYGFDERKTLEAIKLYREYFSVTGIFENRLYSGIIPMLKQLKIRGKRLFIATSKPEKYAVQIAEHFGFNGYFDAICGIPLDAEKMSKGDVIARVMSEFSLSPKATLMVGDRSYDAVGAAENGLDCIGVLYGYGSRAELEAAHTVFNAETVEQLADFLEGKQ